jgi:hypothetical protein
MDDLIITEEMAVDAVVQQLREHDLSGAKRICDLVYEGDKEASRIEALVNMKVMKAMVEGTWTHTVLFS